MLYKHIGENQKIKEKIKENYDKRRKLNLAQESEFSSLS